MSLISKLKALHKKHTTQYEVIIEYKYNRHRDSIFTNELIKSDLSIAGVRYYYDYTGKENKLNVLVTRKFNKHPESDKVLSIFKILSILKRYTEIKDIKCSDFIEVDKTRIK